MGFYIQLYDTDVAGLRRAAQRLRRTLAIKGIDATVEEVTCFLEISRQGYMKKLPVLRLDGRCMCTGYCLSDELFDDFSNLLKEYMEIQSS